MTNSKFLPLYDLESLNEQQRQDYVRNVCEHMGVPPELNLVMLTYLDETDGPRRLVAYAKRGATEIIRNNRGISVTDLTSKEVGGSIVFTATGKDNTGRQEMSTGSKWISGLQGRELDDSIMTAQTRATRRMTLQFVGAGVLDESEVNPANTIQFKESNPLPPALQPIAAPVNAPGKDVTPELAIDLRSAANLNTDPNRKKGFGPVDPESQLAFEINQAKLRQDAIAQLNNQVSAELATPNEPEKGASGNGSASTPSLTEPEVRIKRKYVRKLRNQVDLGPSVVPIKDTAVPETGTTPVPPAQPISVAPPVQQPISVAAAPVPPVPSKPRLTPEQVKPYRQRLFKIVNDLETAGFAPKEGIGNQDKMRSFATLMFSEVQNMNELVPEQWERYLSTLEQKIQKEGAVATISYIEGMIGV
jgi:hypothetical protein